MINRPIAAVALIILFVALISPTAAFSLDETIYDEKDTTMKGSAGAGAGFQGSGPVDLLVLPNIENAGEIRYLAFIMEGEVSNPLPVGVTDLTLSGDFTGTGRVHIQHMHDILGRLTGIRGTIFLDDYTTSDKTGTQTIHVSPAFCNKKTWREPDVLNVNDFFYMRSSSSHSFIDSITECVRVSYLTWKNRIEVDDTDTDKMWNIRLTRVLDRNYYSAIYALKPDNQSTYIDSGNEDVLLRIWKDDITGIVIQAPTGANYTYELGTGPADPGTAEVTVYVKNSQTGALIANANIAIDALVNGEYYPVTNRTEPSGIFNINLQPTGGGQPNPDGYRLIVTADGYNNPMPEINFTVDDYKLSIHCLLDPIAGGPVNENKTFIDFFVRDMSSNPISGATVKFGKYTLITNSAGYTVFEVDKNNDYTWTISKSGYGPLTGNAVIGDAPRHTINTVLAPITTPTTQTPTPTGTVIGPTPTMTAPTGEHVSNWLEWFAAHFGMILGGGVEIGKIFMWLCFTVPVGVYVGKEAKAGAAGFMAGAGIVTLFFVLIGWVPIWLVVLLALIIGLFYAKVFNTPDNGGGR